MNYDIEDEDCVDSVKIGFGANVMILTCWQVNINTVNETKYTLWDLFLIELHWSVLVLRVLDNTSMTLRFKRISIVIKFFI